MSGHHVWVRVERRAAQSCCVRPPIKNSTSATTGEPSHVASAVPSLFALMFVLKEEPSVNSFITQITHIRYRKPGEKESRQVPETKGFTQHHSLPRRMAGSGRRSPFSVAQGCRQTPPWLLKPTLGPANTLVSNVSN